MNADCELDCICKNCAHDEDGECVEGTCEQAKDLKNCPIKYCPTFSQRE